MFKGPFEHSIIKRAKEKGLIKIKITDIREFGIGTHKTVDDKPYGGGVGMLMRVDVVKAAIDGARDKNFSKDREKVILLSAAGEKYTQQKAEAYSKLSHLILVCGHYEGVDSRIENFVSEEISIGDFVLTGGEIPAMIVADSVSRLVSDVLKTDATQKESFSENLLEHRQYTKPQAFEGIEVPKVLLSGNHKKIEEWRKKESIQKTKENRPDLIKDRR